MSKILLPDTIHDHPRSQRIFTRHQPAGKVEPGGLVRLQGRQNRRHPGLHLVGGPGEIAFDKKGGLARLRQLLHHQCGGAILEGGFELQMPVIQRIENRISRAGHRFEKNALIANRALLHRLGHALDGIRCEQLLRLLAELLFPFLQDAETLEKMRIHLLQHLPVLRLQHLTIAARIHHGQGGLILVVQKSKHPVILALADGIKLVIMTLRATNG